MIAALCVLVGAPFGYAMARADGSERGQLLLRMAVVLAIVAVPPLVGRWRARRDTARGIAPGSHRLTGPGLRDALVVALGVCMIGLGIATLFVEPATGDGLSPVVPFGLGALLVTVGIASGRRQRS